MRVGDPLDEATQMGPLISADQLRDGRLATCNGDAPVAIPRLGARRARLLVPADRARAGLQRRPRRPARRSSGRSPP